MYYISISDNKNKEHLNVVELKKLDIEIKSAKKPHEGHP